MPRGRPTRYRPEYANQARQAYQLGACDEDIARFFEIDISTFYRWRKWLRAPFTQTLTFSRQGAILYLN